VKPDHPLWPLGGLRLGGDGQGRGVRGEVSVVLDDLVDLAPHLKFAVEVLGDRLDHQVRLRELAVVQGWRDPAEHGIRLGLLHFALLDRAGELLGDLSHALVQLVLVDLAHDHVPPRLGANLRDPVAHEPAAQDADLADRHICRSPLVASMRGCAARRDPSGEVAEPSEWQAIYPSPIRGVAGRNRATRSGFESR
jgi:hypothetical protein